MARTRAARIFGTLTNLGAQYKNRWWNDRDRKQCEWEFPAGSIFSSSININTNINATTMQTGQYMELGSSAPGSPACVTNPINPSTYSPINGIAAIAQQTGYRTAKIARQLGVSTRTLERAVWSEHKQVPREFLKNLRFSLAREMLGRRARVKEVAVAVGYSDASHFTRAFKQYCGYTPIETRANA